MDCSRKASFDDDDPSSYGQRALELVKRRLPITEWISEYTKKDSVSDLIAGITVGLTVVPQSMAYAAIAGLTPEYGLYSSYIGVLVYVLLGSCRQATIGPTAVMGLLTFQTCGNDNPSCAILVGFYSGVFELVLAVLRLGWVVSFISEPVTIGFTAGAACTILSSQVKSLFGMTGDKGDGFLGYWEAIIRDFTTIHLGDAVMGITAFAVLMGLRQLKDVKLQNRGLSTGIWLTSLSRNVIVILITSLIAYLWKTPPFKLVGYVQGGFPPLSLPPFNLPVMDPHANTTILGQVDQHYYTFWESWSCIKTGPLVIGLISILQNVAISKAFGSGQKVDATQEMLALGTVNIVGGFFSAIPTSASFSRSAVNEASGVRTPLGGLYTGILVLLSLGFLTPSFYYIPKSSLAAVIIGAVIFMIDYETIVPMWKISKMDAVACLITFASSLYLGMEYGILVGVGASVGALLYKTLKPNLNPELHVDQDTGIRYLLIQPESSGVSFPSVDHISSTVQKLTLKHRNTCRVIVINFSKWNSYDYTAANMLLSLVKGMNKNDKVLIFTDCTSEWVDTLKLAGLANPPICHGGAGLSQYLRQHCQQITLEDIRVSAEGSFGSSPSISVSDESSSRSSCEAGTGSSANLV